MSANTILPGAWHAALTDLGFTRDGRQRLYRHNGLTVRLDRHWLTAVTAAPEGADPLVGQLGKPGLWTVVADEDEAARGPRRLRREFHLPLRVLAAPSDDEDPDEAGCPLEPVLAWIGATALDDLPPGWTCPTRGQVESWLPEGGLTVEVQPRVAQGSLVCGGDRLALRVPLATEITGELPEARREWIREVLADAQARWRMVRVGLEGPPQRASAVAEVDLSGAPPAILESLFTIGLESLRWVSAWLIGSAGLLADARVGCRLWETGPERV